MNFKTIFIVFNLIIIAAFLIIFLMPVFFIGFELFPSLISNNWLAIILFSVIIFAFNFYFFWHWELYRLLEQENWKDLIIYLEQQIYKNNNIKRNYLKILIECYLITADIPSLFKLKAHLDEMKPAFIREFGLQFGIPYFVQNNPPESEKFFGKLLAEKKLKNESWIRWNYAFTLKQLKQETGAIDEFEKILDTSRDPLLLLLTVYILNSFLITKTELWKKINQKKNELKQVGKLNNWNKKFLNYKGNIQTIFLADTIKKASEWIFETETNSQSKDEKVGVN
jgi:tetratricopeptide (TPR) repeat protein